MRSCKERMNQSSYKIVVGCKNTTQGWKPEIIPFMQVNHTDRNFG